MGYTDVKFSTSDSLWQSVYDSAVEKEKTNIKDFAGRNVLIEGGGYNGIWLETQPMGGEMYASRNLETAMNNQLFFMENIRDDGRIPSVILYTGDNKRPFHLMYSHFQGYCFPYHALNMYYLNGKDREYLLFLYDVLERFDNYLWKTRDSDGDGCLETWCVWDTGEDNCTRFFDAPHSWGDDTAPYGKAKLPYESMDVMSYSYDGRMTLAEIADILWSDSGLGDTWRKKAQAVRDKVKSYLWRDEKGACYDRDCDNRFLDTLIHNNLRCMYHGIFDRYMADRFVFEHLLNPSEFWTPMPLTSIAANDPLFLSEANNNWSGQPQGLTYQRAIRALENYGHYSIIPILGKKLCMAIGDIGTKAEAGTKAEEKSGDIRFTQQYDPYTMAPSPHGDGCYGPSILAFLEYTAKMYGVRIVRDEIIWSCVNDSSESEYTQIWNDTEFRLSAGKDMCEAQINGKTVFSCARGSRVVTGLDGSVKYINLL